MISVTSSDFTFCEDAHVPGKLVTYTLLLSVSSGIFLGPTKEGTRIQGGVGKSVLIGSWAPRCVTCYTVNQTLDDVVNYIPSIGNPTDLKR